MRPEVIVIGPLPPPMHGAAKNTQTLCNDLESAGARIVRIDLSASSLSHRRSAYYHAERIYRNIAGMFKIAASAREGFSLYIVPDGGLGTFYTLAHTILLKSLNFSNFVIHHRTFSYVDRIDWPIKIVTHLTRARATHVFLSPEMARRYQDTYGEVDNIIASNAKFVLEESKNSATPRMQGSLRIGHLSNLCRDKGFFDVADTYEAYMTSGHEAELHLAGPVVEPEVAERLAALKRRYGPSVRHIGPVSGEVKTDFYRMLDVFLFPTRYANEAAPNVVYEALAAGTPVITTGRGCLPEMVHGSRGIIAEPIERFAQLAVGYMSQLSLDGAGVLERRAAIKADVAAEGKRAEAQHEALLAILLGP